MHMDMKTGETLFIDGRPKRLSTGEFLREPRNPVQGHQSIGGSSLLPPNLLQTLLELRSDDQCAQGVTVFARCDPFTGSNRPVAFVEWGTGGGLHQAIVDLGPLGCRFTLMASFLRVTGVNIIGPAAGVVLNATLRATVTAALGAIGGWTHRPTMTVPIPGINAGANSATFAIPAFARELNVYRDPTNAPYTVRIIDGAGNVLARIAVAANVDPPPILLPNGAQSFLIENGAVVMVSMQAVFSLVL